MQFAAQAKEESGDAKGNLQDARAAADSARSAAAAGDNAARTAGTGPANSSLDQATALLGATALIMGGDGPGTWVRARILRTPIRADTATNDQASVDARAQTVSSDLDRMDKQLAEFENVPPDVMVSPLDDGDEDHRVLHALVRDLLRAGRAGPDPAARRGQHRLAGARAREGVWRARVVPGRADHRVRDHARQVRLVPAVRRLARRDPDGVDDLPAGRAAAWRASGGWCCRYFC